MGLSLKDQVKPSGFNIKSHLIGSNLNKSEKETVARNVIVISLRNGDAWFDFTFEDYMDACGRDRSFAGEEACLNDLVHEDGVLTKTGNVYSVNEKFFRTLAKFIK